MSPLEIKRAVEEYLEDNWTRTPIEKRNEGFDPDPAVSFIIYNFNPGAVSSLEIRGAKYRTGVFIIQVFTPLNVGTDEGFSHGGRIEDLFVNQPLGDIEFQAGDMLPKTQPAQKDEELQMNQNNVIIPFTVITG